MNPKAVIYNRSSDRHRARQREQGMSVSRPCSASRTPKVGKSTDGGIHTGARAVILVQPGNPDSDRQTAACHAYCMAQDYRVTAIVPHWAQEDAARAVANGTADVVVVAFDGRAVAAAVYAAGGRVEAVHPVPHVVTPRAELGVLPAVLLRWYDTGRDVKEIAELLDESTTDIREHLRAAGIDPTT